MAKWTDLERLDTKVLSRVNKLDKDNTSVVKLNNGLSKLGYNNIPARKEVRNVDTRTSNELTRIFSNFIRETDKKKLPKATLSYKELTKAKVLSIGMSEFSSLNDADQKRVISKLGSFVKRDLEHLRDDKSGDLTMTSPASKYLLKELKKFNIQWDEDKAMSLSSADRGTKMHFYKIYSEFEQKKTKTAKGFREWLKESRESTGANKYNLTEDQEKQYISNFWYMYHNLNEEAQGIVNSVQGYRDKEFILKGDNKISVQDLIARQDRFYFNEEDANRAKELQELIDMGKATQSQIDEYNNLGTTLKDMLLSFDSRDVNFNSSKLRKEIKDAINLSIRLAYEEGRFRG